jgi:hypothetical protein
MIYAKSILFGLVMAVAATLLYVLAVLYSSTKNRRKTGDDGLAGVAVGPQMLFLTAVFFVFGSGLMYWHLR